MSDLIFARVRHLLAPFGFDVQMRTQLNIPGVLFHLDLLVTAEGHAMQGRTIGLAYTFYPELYYRDELASVPERMASSILMNALAEIAKAQPKEPT